VATIVIPNEVLVSLFTEHRETFCDSFFNCSKIHIHCANYK